ncbi:gamma carbonic anhydrase family protein [Spirochaetota bacterium]
MIHAIGDLEPKIAKDVFIAWNSEVAGDVQIGEECSVWFNCAVRADIAAIRIGSGSNVQDGSVLHVDTDQPCIIGKGVTVGHKALLHGCKVEDNCLIGMGAIILNGAEIAEGSIVGAGSLVTQNKKFPPRSLILGSPAKFIRQITDEEYAHNLANAKAYIKLAKESKTYRKMEE